ncbi:dihydrodipicolinate synthase family protein [Salinibacterium sp. TMP30]|uniref:dihydrodipicolinate synthase family protein n=1 Tax=Salinibacterium sp. TMP30 TaxID=3138237 RepID=UPI0031395C6B
MPVVSEQIRGICPVIETPFSEDGSVDFESFERLIDHLISAGVRQVMFPGFASEFHKLNDEERNALTRTILRKFHDVPDCRVVISVPDHATMLAVRNARAAVDAGADLINILPPYFLGPSASSVRQHIDAILDAISPTPAIVQYAPEQTGTSLDAQVFATIATKRPNLVQVKVESTPPGQLISSLSALNPPLGSVVGYAGVQMIDALRRGAEGVQPGCSFVEIYLRIWSLWESGAEESAIALHGRLLPYISYWMQSVELIIRAEKRISMLRGLIATDHCRAPARELDQQEEMMIDRFISEFNDVFESNHD